MKKVFRLVAILLCITLMCVMTGCNKKKKIEETVDFTWYINFNWFNTSWGDNIVSKAITNKTNCNIQFVTPTGDASEKLDSMIASDTLPDLVTLGWWEPEISEMINKGKVYALDELADKYDMYFYDVVNEQVVNWYTSEDGHIYQYPNSACSPSDYEEYDNLSSNQTFLVRKDIYEAIGSPDMTTPEGFINAVKKAAEMFPVIDGYDLIPVGSTEFTDIGCDSFDNYLMNFLAVPYVDEDGNAIDRLKNKDYIEWLKAFRTLSEIGLLKDEIFIDSRTQMLEKVGKGRYFCMIYQYTDMEEQQKALYSRNPDSAYIAVDGPKNLNGDDYTLPGTSINGWTVTLVSKNCKNPEKAIKLLSYLISEEGQIMTWFGVEGQTFDYNQEGKPELKAHVKDWLIKDRNVFDENYGADSCYWMLQNEAMASKWIVDNEIDPTTQLKNWTKPYTVYNGQYTITFDAESEVGIIKNRADALWGETLPELLLASTEEEFDKIYNDFIKERYNLGYDKVLDAFTDKINENIKKLGL